LDTLEIPGVGDDVLSRHLEMLLNAGLIEGIVTGSCLEPYPKILVKDLSWDGHELAGALADEGIWKKLKETYSPSEMAKLPLKAIGEVAKALITKWALSKAGLG
jgi:Hypothetical protein (DUF2513)